MCKPGNKKASETYVINIEIPRSRLSIYLHIDLYIEQSAIAERRNLLYKGFLIGRRPGKGRIKGKSPVRWNWKHRRRDSRKVIDPYSRHVKWSCWSLDI